MQDQYKKGEFPSIVCSSLLPLSQNILILLTRDVNQRKSRPPAQDFALSKIWDYFLLTNQRIMRDVKKIPF